MKKLLACLLVVSTSGCPDVNVDPDELEGGPTVEFDPARSRTDKARFIPFPNDLARDPMTGKLNLTEQNCESPTSKATRENVLNKLDGFGTYQTAMQVTFTEAVDPASIDVEGADANVVMFQLTSGGMPLATPRAIPIVVARVGETVRFENGNNCDMPKMVAAVTFAPAVPLEQKSTYFVTLLKGIKSSAGEDFAPAFTWALVASEEAPVTLDEQGNVLSDRTPLDPANADDLESLRAVAQMWELHKPGLTAVGAATGRPRGEMLVGFQFTTQTVQDPLDPNVAGSPAAKLTDAGLLLPKSVTNNFMAYSALCTNEGGQPTAQCFLKLALGGCSPLTTGCLPEHYARGNTICTSFGCAAVGDVIGAGVAQSSYQQLMMTNPLTGGAPIPGTWTDPVNPEVKETPVLQAIAVVPAAAAPTDGYPVVVFGHGLGSSKEALFAIASQLAAQGYASIAIDTQSHGSRAVRTSRDLALGCRGRCGTYDAISGTTTFLSPAVECDTIAECPNPTSPTTRCGDAGPVAAPAPMFVPPSPTTASQCYAPFLSADLAVMRDGIRQTVLDNQRLVRAIKACATGCTVMGGQDLKIDPTKIYYVGQSLGSIIGTMTVGTTPDIKTAVLNVGGVGWADVLENTQTLPIRCLLVNGLIDAGILQGEKWTGGATGLCTTDAWKAQPGYATFAAIGRWVLDPADPANFASRNAAKKILIQEVVDDQVVPNIATQRQAALMGLTMPGMADVYLPPGATNPSAAITTNPTTNKYVRYQTMPADSGSGFPGNIFEHPSLLRPSAGTGGTLGTARLQTDAITFLLLNQ